jgi:hypothetical protein
VPLKNTAVTLVEFDRETRNFKTSSEGISFLKSLPRKPFSVVAIGGIYRHGKSFLLNQLIGSPVFEVSNGLSGCTQGIVAWADVPSSIIYLDTSGLGDTENGETIDNKILILSFLLSSVYLYNSVGTISSVSLDQFEYPQNKIILLSLIIQPFEYTRRICC